MHGGFMIFRTMLTMALLISFCAPVSATAAQDITSKNWMDHPAVKEIREILMRYGS